MFRTLQVLCAMAWLCWQLADTAQAAGIRKLFASSPQSLYNDSSLDDPLQRSALMAVYDATGGANWSWAQGVVDGRVGLWGQSSSYCLWFGVTCCASSALSMVPCKADRSVVILSLENFGLQGTVPSELSSLAELTVLGLSSNPLLTGSLPSSMRQLTQLLWLSVAGTGLHTCSPATGAQYPASTCQLPAFLHFSKNRSAISSPPSASPLQCPSVLLDSFLISTADTPPSLLPYITMPFPQPSPPGAVIAAPAFTQYYNCTCTEGRTLSFSGGVALCTTPTPGTSSSNSRYIIAIVLVAVLPISAFMLGAIIFIRYKAKIHQMVKLREEKMEQKRRRIPGMPGVALVNGRGIVPDTDPLVTWVFTDVAGSTKLWEDYPNDMSKAIDMHNSTVRELLDEFAGHEIRNEGDSFALAFHDAIDAVQFCIKTQEALQKLEWPERLLQDDLCRTVTAGDCWKDPQVAGQGGVVMSGLRVRMGINTGHAESMVLQDMTEEVGYRGAEYDLAYEISDVAAGGQILMGPKTFQRWNKMSGSSIPVDPITALVREASNNSLGGVVMSQSVLAMDSSAMLLPSIDGPSYYEHGNPMMAGKAPSTIWQRRYPSVIHYPSALRASSEVQRPSNAALAGLRRDLGEDSQMLPGLQRPSRPIVSGSFLGYGLQHRRSVTIPTPEAMQGGLMEMAGGPFGAGPAVMQQRQQQALRQQVLLQQGQGQAQGLWPGSGQSVSLAHPQEVELAGSRVPLDPPRTLEPLRTVGYNGQHKSRMSIEAAVQPSTPDAYRRRSLREGDAATGSGGTTDSPRFRRVAGGPGSAYTTGGGSAWPLHMDAGGSGAGGLQALGAVGAVGGVGLGLATVPGPLSFSPTLVADRESLDPHADLERPTDDAATLRHHSLYSVGHRLLSNVTHLGRRWASTTTLAGPNQRHPGMTHGAGAFSSRGDESGHPDGYAFSASPVRGSSSGFGGLQKMFSRACGSLAFRCLGCIRLASSATDGVTGSRGVARRASAAFLGFPERMLGAKDAPAPAAGAPTAKCVLLDMGCYEWRRGGTVPQPPVGGGGASGFGAEGPGEGSEPNRIVHLMQVVPASVAPRVLLFPWPLVSQSWEKVSPGFFDAPAASRLTFPMMRDIPGAGLGAGAIPRPHVCVAFTSIEGYKEISAFSLQLSREVLYLHNAAVRETLSACGGYECKENDGGFLVAFTDCCQGMEWAVTLQLALMEMHWSPELLALDVAAEVLEPRTTRALLRGVRCRIGMFQGSIDRVTPNVKSGRADYFGQPCNRAARLMSAAYGGQIVCEHSIVEGVVAEWKRRYGGAASSTGGGASATDLGPGVPGGVAGAMVTAGGSGSRSPLGLEGPESVGAMRDHVTARSFLNLNSSFTGRPMPSPRHSTPHGVSVPSPRGPTPLSPLFAGPSWANAVGYPTPHSPTPGAASAAGLASPCSNASSTPHCAVPPPSLHDSVEAAVMAVTPRGRAAGSRSMPSSARHALPGGGVPFGPPVEAPVSGSVMEAPSRESVDFLSLPPSPNLLRNPESIPSALSRVRGSALQSDRGSPDHAHIDTAGGAASDVGPASPSGHGGSSIWLRSPRGFPRGQPPSRISGAGAQRLPYHGLLPHGASGSEGGGSVSPLAGGAAQRLQLQGKGSGGSGGSGSSRVQLWRRQASQDITQCMAASPLKVPSRTLSSNGSSRQNSHQSTPTRDPPPSIAASVAAAANAVLGSSPGPGFSGLSSLGPSHGSYPGLSSYGSGPHMSHSSSAGPTGPASTSASAFQGAYAAAAAAAAGVAAPAMGSSPPTAAGSSSAAYGSAWQPPVRVMPSAATLELLAPLSPYNKVKLQHASWDPSKLGQRRGGASRARRNSQGSVTPSNLSAHSNFSGGGGGGGPSGAAGSGAYDGSSVGDPDSHRLPRLMHGAGVPGSVPAGLARCSGASSSPLASGPGGAVFTSAQAARDSASRVTSPQQMPMQIACVPGGVSTGMAVLAEVERSSRASQRRQSATDGLEYGASSAGSRPMSAPAHGMILPPGPLFLAPSPGVHTTPFAHAGAPASLQSPSERGSPGQELRHGPHTLGTPGASASERASPTDTASVGTGTASRVGSGVYIPPPPLHAGFSPGPRRPGSAGGPSDHSSSVYVTSPTEDPTDPRPRVTFASPGLPPRSTPSSGGRPHSRELTLARTGSAGRDSGRGVLISTPALVSFLEKGSSIDFDSQRFMQELLNGPLLTEEEEEEAGGVEVPPAPVSRAGLGGAMAGATTQLQRSASARDNQVIRSSAPREAARRLAMSMHGAWTAPRPGTAGARTGSEGGAQGDPSYLRGDEGAAHAASGRPSQRFHRARAGGRLGSGNGSNLVSPDGPANHLPPPYQHRSSQGHRERDCTSDTPPLPTMTWYNQHSSSHFQPAMSLTHSSGISTLPPGGQNPNRKRGGVDAGFRRTSPQEPHGPLSYPHSTLHPIPGSSPGSAPSLAPHAGPLSSPAASSNLETFSRSPPSSTLPSQKLRFAPSLGPTITEAGPSSTAPDSFHTAGSQEHLWRAASAQGRWSQDLGSGGNVPLTSSGVGALAGAGLGPMMGPGSGGQVAGMLPMPPFGLPGAPRPPHTGPTSEALTSATRGPATGAAASSAAAGRFSTPGLGTGMTALATPIAAPSLTHTGSGMVAGAVDGARTPPSPCTYNPTGASSWGGAGGLGAVASGAEDERRPPRNSLGSRRRQLGNGASQRDVLSSPSPRGSSSMQKAGEKDGAEDRLSTPRTVQAEVFKITPSNANGEDAHGPSYTVFSYKIDEMEEQPDEEDEDLVPPGAATLIPTVPVEVSVWSLGSYRLKGMAELMRVVQVVPQQLEGRMQLFQKGALDKGKARCITRDISKLHQLSIRLPSVKHMTCCMPLVYDDPAATAAAAMVAPGLARMSAGGLGQAQAQTAGPWGPQAGVGVAGGWHGSASYAMHPGAASGGGAAHWGMQGPPGAPDAGLVSGPGVAGTVGPGVSSVAGAPAPAMAPLVSVFASGAGVAPGVGPDLGSPWMHPSLMPATLAAAYGSQASWAGGLAAAMGFGASAQYQGLESYPHMALPLGPSHQLSDDLGLAVSLDVLARGMTRESDNGGLGLARISEGGATESMGGLGPSPSATQPVLALMPSSRAAGAGAGGQGSRTPSVLGNSDADSPGAHAPGGAAGEGGGGGPGTGSGGYARQPSQTDSPMQRSRPPRLMIPDTSHLVTPGPGPLAQVLQVDLSRAAQGFGSTQGVEGASGQGRRGEAGAEHPPVVEVPLGQGLPERSASTEPLTPLLLSASSASNGRNSAGAKHQESPEAPAPASGVPAAASARVADLQGSPIAVTPWHPVPRDDTGTPGSEQQPLPALRGQAQAQDQYEQLQDSWAPQQPRQQRSSQQPQQQPNQQPQAHLSQPPLQQTLRQRGLEYQYYPQEGHGQGEGQGQRQGQGSGVAPVTVASPAEAPNSQALFAPDTSLASASGGMASRTGPGPGLASAADRASHPSASGNSAALRPRHSSVVTQGSASLSHLVRINLADRDLGDRERGAGQMEGVGGPWGGGRVCCGLRGICYHWTGRP